MQRGGRGGGPSPAWKRSRERGQRLVWGHCWPGRESSLPALFVWPKSPSLAMTMWYKTFPFRLTLHRGAYQAQLTKFFCRRSKEERGTPGSGEASGKMSSVNYSSIFGPAGMMKPPGGGPTVSLTPKLFQICEMQCFVMVCAALSQRFSKP